MKGDGLPHQHLPSEVTPAATYYDAYTNSRTWVSVGVRIIAIAGI